MSGYISWLKGNWVAGKELNLLMDSTFLRLAANKYSVMAIKVASLIRLLPNSRVFMNVFWLNAPRRALPPSSPSSFQRKSRTLSQERFNLISSQIGSTVTWSILLFFRSIFSRVGVFLTNLTREFKPTVDPNPIMFHYAWRFLRLVPSKAVHIISKPNEEMLFPLEYIGCITWFQDDAATIGDGWEPIHRISWHPRPPSENR